MVAPMLLTRHTGDATQPMRMRLALGLLALACAAPAAAAATVQLRATAVAKPVVHVPRAGVAGGQAVGSIVPGSKPAGGWLGAIAP